MTNNQIQIEDALREVGYRQREEFPDIWKLPGGEGAYAYLTEEALFLEWQKTVRRAGQADHRVEQARQYGNECYQSLVVMGIGTSIIILILTIGLALHA